jgi:protein-L-isoaspartate O-methyltransferase
VLRSTSRPPEMERKVKSLSRYRASTKEEKFAGNKFYQSFDRLNIEGDRDTTRRIVKYKFREELTPQDRVLNIGSNCGFLDLEVASLVESITCVEHSVKLTTMQRILANHFKLSNVTVINEPFTLNTKLGEKYSVIFLLAVISHLKIEPDALVEKIKGMLEPGGRVLLESHSIKPTSKYVDFIKAFEGVGFQLMWDDVIEVDNRSLNRNKYRKFCWLKLTE